MAIMAVQMVQEVAIGALNIPVEMKEDSGVMMILVVDVTSRIMEVDLLGVALEVVVDDQVHIQVCLIIYVRDLTRLCMYVSIHLMQLYIS
jgi:hypothetical protein